MLCFFVQKTAYDVRISDWSSDVCSYDLESHAGHVAVDGAVLEARHVVAAVALGEVGFGPVAAGQQAARERRVGDEADAEPAAGRQYLCLDIAGGERVLGLQCGDGMGRLGTLQGPGAGFGKTEVRSEEHTSELQSLMR